MLSEGAVLAGCGEEKLLHRVFSFSVAIKFVRFSDLEELALFGHTSYKAWRSCIEINFKILVQGKASGAAVATSRPSVNQC